MYFHWFFDHVLIVLLVHFQPLFFGNLYWPDHTKLIFGFETFNNNLTIRKFRKILYSIRKSSLVTFHLTVYYFRNVLRGKLPKLLLKELNTISHWILKRVIYRYVIYWAEQNFFYITYSNNFIETMEYKTTVTNFKLIADVDISKIVKQYFHFNSFSLFRVSWIQKNSQFLFIASVFSTKLKKH